MRGIVVRAVGVALAWLLPGLASGAEIVVDSVTDDPADNTSCTLRDALAAANTDSAVDGCTAGAGEDWIILDSVTYVLTEGSLTISSEVAIAGQGAASTTISGGGNDRVFHVSAAGALTLEDTTITGATMTSSFGGAVLVYGSIEATRCRFTGNQQSANNGGAITLDTGSTGTFLDCEFDQNLAADQGGAIEVFGATASFVRCWVHDNHAGTDGSGDGGAFAVAGGSATQVIADCLINANTAPGHGGGLRLYSSAGLSVTNTTISGNTAGGSGGGIYSSDSGYRFDFSHVTIAHNMASTSGGGSAGVASTFSFVNTIFAYNIAGDGSHNCNHTSPVAAEHHNLLDDVSGCSAFVDGSDAIGDPLLLPLAYNGGATMTHQVLAGSPARGAGDCMDVDGNLLTADQRGHDRPNGNCTIGAFEVLDAYTALITTTSEAAGGNCSGGGYLLAIGLDLDQDQTLDDDEITSTQYVCNGEDAQQPLFVISDEAPGGSCLYGGKSISYGPDTDGDQVLTEAETASTQYVCDGAPGENGEDGTPGSDAVQPLVEVSDEASGDNCEHGGVIIRIGFDGDASGVLETGEVVSTQYVCDGAPGADGAAGMDGMSALAAVTDEPAGDNCSTGGQRIEVGADLDENGLLDAGEVTNTQYVCNGTDASQPLVAVTEEPAGDNCADGGSRIDFGLDADDDGVLGEGEIAGTHYVCHGAEGAAAEQPLLSVVDEPAGQNCAAGGFRLDVGLDDDGNGELSSGEVISAHYLCNGEAGADANGTLLVTAEEPAGANCAHGGLRVTSGLDDDGNGSLEAGEVDATELVCNGAPGEAGADGASTLVAITNLPAGDADCPHGGIRIQSGLDDGGTDAGAASAGDGSLDHTEVDHTSYVCAVVGAAGEAGPAGEAGAPGEPGPAGANGSGCVAGGEGSPFGPLGVLSLALGILLLARRRTLGTQALGRTPGRAPRAR